MKTPVEFKEVLDAIVKPFIPLIQHFIHQETGDGVENVWSFLMHGSAEPYILYRVTSPAQGRDLRHNIQVQVSVEYTATPAKLRALAASIACSLIDRYVVWKIQQRQATPVDINLASLKPLPPSTVTIDNNIEDVKPL